MNRFVSQSFLAVVSLSASIALAGTESYDYKEAPPPPPQSWCETPPPQSAFAWCENISAYAIGAVAAFWLIERTLSFVA